MSSRYPSGPPFRLAVVDTNPVQYRVPLWREIERDGRISLKVFYASRIGLEPGKVPGFGSSWVWDVPLLDGYDHEFLESVDLPVLPRPGGNRFPLGLTAKLREGSFDAVLVLGYVSAAALAGMLAGLRLGLPLVLRGESHERGSRPTLAKRLKHLVLPLLLRRVAAVLAIGEWNREYWISLGVPERKIWTAPYAVDNAHFVKRLTEEPSRPAELRAKWGAGAKDVVFLYCGKLFKPKAPEMLVEAFARLAHLPNVHLVIVGTGPMESELRERAAQFGIERFHWEGFVNQRDLAFHYRAADVFVLPSRYEPWGLVVNEAMICGTPCIVSDVVGAGADLVSGKRTGLVFERDDVESLTSAIQQAMDPVLRESWRGNLEAALANASFDQNVARLVDCVATLTRRSEPTPA